MSTVNEKMTAIADQIRTLIGATGAMGLDAMATNLTTANSAVASAKTAITDKGVSVSEDAGVDDLAALIESIAAGYEVVTGEIVPATNQTSISVDHGLGRTPVIAVIFPQFVPYTNPAGFVIDYISGSTMQLTAYFIDGVGNGTYSQNANGIQLRKGGSVTANDTRVVFSSYSNSPFYSSSLFPYKYVIVG